VFESLTRELADLAEKAGISLGSLEAFGEKTTEW
jgi:hypothetical protein